MEIAKFRAARMLWANIVASYHPECLRDCDNKGANGECRCAAKMAVHAETSTFNLTLFDAHVNLLRTQTEAMSAALAGVDSMTVVPFDKTYSTPDEFSERLARNQQLLLKEESHFDKVIDPAAGSYYIENLTVSIAKQAWELFLAVEEAGGFYAALKAGTVQAAVNESNKARHKAVAQRREVLLGTNQFPNFNEKAGEKQPIEAKCCCGGDAHTCEKDVDTLVFDRAASELEPKRNTRGESRAPLIAIPWEPCPRIHHGITCIAVVSMRSSGQILLTPHIPYKKVTAKSSPMHKLPQTRCPHEKMPHEKDAPRKRCPTPWRGAGSDGSEQLHGNAAVRRVSSASWQ